MDQDDSSRRHRDRPQRRRRRRRAQAGHSVPSPECQTWFRGGSFRADSRQVFQLFDGRAHERGAARLRPHPAARHAPPPRPPPALREGASRISALHRRRARALRRHSFEFSDCRQKTQSDSARRLRRRLRPLVPQLPARHPLQGPRHDEAPLLRPHSCHAHHGPALHRRRAVRLRLQDLRPRPRPKKKRTQRDRGRSPAPLRRAPRTKAATTGGLAARSAGARRRRLRALGPHRRHVRQVPQTRRRTQRRPHLPLRPAFDRRRVCCWGKNNLLRDQWPLVGVTVLFARSSFIFG
mmetsp:Transcript_15622/g.47230  ORF Transcript_15622/g.47230 Transcript_15622/m.47230 type:complete len:294 (-) Transcript_15622:50-931(-)